jgi:hypothetical protein
MDLDLHYDTPADRIRLRVPPERSAHTWWLTRRLVLPLLTGWLERLEALPLPPPAATPWTQQPARLSLAQQHALLMEYDGPRPGPLATPAGRTAPRRPAKPMDGPYAGGLDVLVHTARLRVGEPLCTLTLVSDPAQLALNLNRHDAHGLLEAVARLCRHARWLQGVEFPAWLGTPEPGDPAEGPPHAPCAPGQPG